MAGLRVEGRAAVASEPCHHGLDLATRDVEDREIAARLGVGPWAVLQPMKIV